MSVISSPNAVGIPTGLLGFLVSDSAVTQNRLTQLSEQSSSGLIAQTYGGIGAQAQIALNLAPQLTQITAYGQNINTANLDRTIEANRGRACARYHLNSR